MKSLSETLREHKELCDKATPGPWTCYMGTVEEPDCTYQAFHVDTDKQMTMTDKHFIAQSHTLWPRYIKALERALLTANCHIESYLSEVDAELAKESLQMDVLAILRGGEE